MMSHENLRLYKSVIKLIGSKGLKTGILIKVMYIDYSEFRAKVFLIWDSKEIVYIDYYSEYTA